MMIQKGVRAELVDQMLREAPIIVKHNLSLAVARKYADMLCAMGAKITILEQDPDGQGKGLKGQPAPMSSFLPCPRCGLVQQDSGTCPRCGFDLTVQGTNGEAHVTSDRT